MMFDPPKTNYENRKRFLNLKYDEDRAMVNEPPENWVETAIMNGYPYNAGEEKTLRFFYRDVMRFLRKKLRTEGEIWLIQGTLTCRVVFVPHPKLGWKSP